MEIDVFEMYKKKINDAHCEKCNGELDNKLPNGHKRCPPQSFWNIGSNLVNKTKPRLTFVGKTSWNTPEDLENDEKDPFPISYCGYVARDFFNELGRFRYWHDIRYITHELNLELEDIAITNLVKCNIYDENDKNDSFNKTPPAYFEQCVDIFEEEMKIIRPTHIVFFTGDNYDYLIDGLRFWFKGPNCTYHDHPKEEKEYKRKIKGKAVCWWHRTFYKDNKPKMHFLRTRHPQGAKLEVREEIIKWVKSTDVFKQIK